MEGTDVALSSAIASAISEAIEKAKANELSLVDMYVQVKYDDQTLSVFDDAENLLAQATLDGLDDWQEADGGEDAPDALVALLRSVLESEEVDRELRSLDVIAPFSVVLVDGAMEPVADLVTLDDENIYLHDEFWAKMDKELDDFFEQLMADTK